MKKHQFLLVLLAVALLTSSIFVVADAYCNALTVSGLDDMDEDSYKYQEGSSGDYQFRAAGNICNGFDRNEAENWGYTFFIEKENVSASDIAADSINYLDHINLEIVVTKEIESMLAELINNHEDLLILLSPRNWGSVDERWRNRTFIKPIELT